MLVINNVFCGMCYHMLCCRQDRKSMRAQQVLLSQEVAEKKLSEAKFREQCGVLERQLSELVSVIERRELEFNELVKKLEATEKECTDGKVSSVQLKADLKYAEEQKRSLEEKVLLVAALVQELIVRWSLGGHH